MRQYATIKKLFLSVAVATLTTVYADSNLTIKNIAQNPEGIEYDKTDHTFLLSSLNALPNY